MGFGNANFDRVPAPQLISQTTFCMGKVNGKLFKVSLNIKKCTNVSDRALHQCKKAHCGKLTYVIRKPNGESALACNVRAPETQL